jgi:AraC-like DNA-binding protein
MGFQQFVPSDILKPHIKCFWVFTNDRDNATEVLYPSGYLELAINISSGQVATIIGDRYIKMPKVEVLGQLTSPVKLTATKGVTLLIARFYPHASSLFLHNQASDFTNDSIDLNDVFKNEATALYHQMMEQDSILYKISILETFLIRKLRILEKKQEKLRLVEQICSHAYQDGEFFNLANLASHYGFSERHIQKLFLEFTGLSPKRLFNIHRFNRSLELVRSSGSPLTSIAYESGYYDQAHFIKEFKSFTGVTPSEFQQVRF